MGINFAGLAVLHFPAQISKGNIRNTHCHEKYVKKNWKLIEPIRGDKNREKNTEFFWFQVSYWFIILFWEWSKRSHGLRTSSYGGLCGWWPGSPPPLQRSHVWPLCWHNHVKVPDVWIAVLMALQTFCSLKNDNNICIKSTMNADMEVHKTAGDYQSTKESVLKWKLLASAISLSTMIMV